MNELNVVYLALAAVLFVVLAIGARHVVRARARGRRRVVEQPNSHYAPPAVRAAEVKHRWQSIVLDRIHEINRDEVVRLLAKAEAVGVDALRENERSFLDYLTEMTERPVAPEPPPRKRPITPDLQHRPA